MFGSAFAAASRPSHEDWLNDLSSRPPVSVTMQAEKAVAPGDCDPPPPPPFLFLALAHAAVTSASTLSAAAALNVPLTSISSAGRLSCRQIAGLCPCPTGQGTKGSPGVPPRDDCQRIYYRHGCCGSG